MEDLWYHRSRISSLTLLSPFPSCTKTTTTHCLCRPRIAFVRHSRRVEGDGDDSEWERAHRRIAFRGYLQSQGA